MGATSIVMLCCDSCVIVVAVRFGDMVPMAFVGKAAVLAMICWEIVLVCVDKCACA